MHMQIACSVRVALCTCCALCAIQHMTQKHWCVRAAREREEGVKTHRYAVLKGCRERDIVRPPTPVQITPELPTITVFYSRVARNLVGSREKSAVMTVMTSTPRSASHYRGEAVMRLSSQPYLADAFIQSDLQCIQVINFLVSTCVPWESNPQPLRCKRNAPTTEPQEHCYCSELHSYCSCSLEKQSPLK